MLAIRMQRTGRTGHAMFRIVVQNSRRTPTSGDVVAFLGSYDPHSKQVLLDKEKVALFLKNGAQPSERVARLLKSEGVKLPDWVVIHQNKKGKVRNESKLKQAMNDSNKSAVVSDSKIEANNPESAVASEDISGQEDSKETQINAETEKINETAPDVAVD